ncbi:MAG: serine O-acetyltransferase [Pseudomonadota bacterium]
MASHAAFVFCEGTTSWEAIRAEATQEVSKEPLLGDFFNARVLNRASLEDALSFGLSQRLACGALPFDRLREIFDAAYADESALSVAACKDLEAVRDRDPATSRISDALLYLKGFQALQGYRVAHWLWNQQRESIALVLQSQISLEFGVDIHPAARLGAGIMFDHATSIVIGETAVIDDDVSILHEVTLGGTGKQVGQRHPKIRRGVLIGAGAKLLGNIEVGAFAKIGAGSVVLDDVPAGVTVAGVPAVVVGTTDGSQPALDMDHRLPTQ